ncbi:hypothetical protein RB195_010614 [Necator americanus]|uniref:Uncharacterized protein n=1 Tax=Necator americanus TaxID=51031 RepID=A0ABR1D019_NECAM
MFDFLPRRAHKQRSKSSLDIGQPFDFRVEIHIEPDSSVTHVLNFINQGTKSKYSRPNFLTPDPNWPTVGKISRAPLTNEEIERSPFGRLLPPSAARMDILPGTAGTATVPSSPIPKAPSRFRNKIPSQWTEETGAQISGTHRPLQRTHSKSLPQLTAWSDDVSARCSCEVCKMGTITNRIYFPSSTLQAQRTGNRSIGEKDGTKEEYDEIDRQNTNKSTTAAVVRRVPKTACDSSGYVAHPRLTAVKNPPSPPPRGVPNKKSQKDQLLDFSPIASISSAECDDLEVASKEGSVSETEGTLEICGRSSMDSGISDKHSDDEEVTVTRL